MYGVQYAISASPGSIIIQLRQVKYTIIGQVDRARLIGGIVWHIDINT